MRKQHQMNRLSRPGRRALAVAGVSLLALTAAACSSSSPTLAGSSTSSSKVTITEIDYYTSSASNEALNWYNAQFMKAHPNITVTRTSVPYPNLITKILQDASAGDMPNLMLIDNPDVPEVAATGQLVPLDHMPGFTTSGYTAGAIAECTYQGKHYCYPIGTNTVGLFYNKRMFAAAHLPPPATWAQLQADAKALTTPAHRGIVFDATSDERSTFQLEPFFWSSGASLTHVNTPQFRQALQLWVNMVTEGSASKSVLTWGEPGITEQFLHTKAAMLEDGPWIFPELNAAGWKYNQQYGIVPIPVQRPGQTVITPLGGETMEIGADSSSAQQRAAWEWIEGMQRPSTMIHLASMMYYLPTKPAVIQQYLKGGPEYTEFAREIETARPRTIEYGANYPKVSQAVWTAIQAAITGTASVSSAVKTAQGTISSIPR